MKIEQAKVFTEMIVFHTQATLTTIEELLKDGKFNEEVRAVLDGGAQGALSVYERAVWETLKDLFDPAINPAAKDYHDSLWRPDAEDKKH